MSQDNFNSNTFNADEAVADLVSIRDFIRWSVSLFGEYELGLGQGYDDPWDESVALILASLHLAWDVDPKVIDSRLLTSEKYLLCERLEQRVIQRVPTAYLTGRCWFAGLPFLIDQRALIPRSPIGELIEQGFQPWVDAAKVESVLDLCTGSGCIGIACAQAFPDATVDCSDISDAALDLAEENVTALGFEQQVNLIYSDLFEALEGRRYDLIVSNPPYVDERDIGEMPAEFHHEPRSALEAGADGLDLVRRMLPELSRHLNPGGVAVIEVGNSWLALEEAYPNVCFTWIEFEHGGDGVFLITKEELDHHQADFVL